jgi:hypothetical protein
MISVAQIRAARGLLKWTQAALEAGGVEFLEENGVRVRHI